MVQISKKDKEKVLEAIHSGKIDTAELALPALADSIMLAMKQQGFLEPLNDVFKDKRSDNMHIPSYILLTAKLKQKTSLTDVPFATIQLQMQGCLQNLAGMHGIMGAM